MRLFSYSIKEVFNNKRFCILFVLNLSLGLTGFIALDGFKVSVDKTIKVRSKAVLGGDFGISSRKVFLPDEIEQVEGSLGQKYDSTSTIEMVSMVANKDKRSRLVQIKAIESNYPFYGEIELEENGVVDKKLHQEIFEKPKVWIYPDLKRQLDLETGDSLTIGEADFRVVDVVKGDAAAGLSTNMAPRIYMHKKFLADTNLLRKGSIAWHSLIYYLPGRTSDQLSEIRDQVFKKLDSPEIQVYTHENTSAQMTAMLARLNDFLGLTSLVALFLAGVGSAFLFRSYFKSRIRQVATLMSMGASRSQSFQYYLLQILILGLVSSVIAIVFSFAIVPGLGAVTKDLLPFNVLFSLNPLSLFFGVLVGTLGSLLICLPILVSLKDIKVGVLLSQGEATRSQGFWAALLSGVPALILFSGLAVWLSNSYQVGGYFVLLFLLSAIILSITSLTLFSSIHRISHFKRLSLKWAIRDVAKKRLTTLVAFIAIGLGALLLNLIPQLRASLSAELDRPEQSKLPSFFMFDIQEEQVDPFKKILAEEQLEFDQVSPTVRARLISVNDQEFDKGKGKAESFSREEEREMRFRNRGFNLSYRAELHESERIIEGVPFSGTFDEASGKLAEISIEKRFAKRLGFKLGDKLKFDIESIPIEGKIINVREVKWTSFQPNFFVQFQPGVLELAPKTFIATLPAMSLDRKYQIQDRLVQELPNISMVDVSRIVKRINEIIEQMSWALAFMSILSLFSGFVVLFSIANHQARTRRFEIGLLKSLGASFNQIRGQFLWQFCLISFFAISLGAILSLIASYVVSLVLFDSLWIFDWKTPVASLLIGVKVTYWVTRMATQKALSTPGRELFGDH